MAHFYGNLKGSRGEATRCGSAYLHTTARSWNGSIRVQLQTIDGVDHVSIFVAPGSTATPAGCLYSGPLAEIIGAEKLIPVPHRNPTGKP